MDLGTGSIIFTSAATWAPVASASSPVTTYLSNSVFLSFYGTAKFLIESSLHYQEHVSEYGKQWNFFLTIALLHLFGNIFKSPTSCLLAGSLLILLYQVLLNNGLSDYVLNAPR